MLHRTASVVVLLVGVAVGQAAHGETTLHLAETATVMAAPDEIAATLRVEATSTTAADAQGRVNAAMQDALTLARKVEGLTVSTGGYRASRSGTASKDPWQVTQTLNLTGHDGPAVLNLVGALQKNGLALGYLGWRLSSAAETQWRAAATRQALTALRGRIDDAAALLDLQFDQFKDIRLDNAAPQPMFRAAPMAMSAAAPPPPSAAPEDVPVSATAEAEAILVPR
jgi:predicted secreted protein